MSSPSNEPCPSFSPYRLYGLSAENQYFQTTNCLPSVLIFVVLIIYLVASTAAFFIFCYSAAREYRGEKSLKGPKTRTFILGALYYLARVVTDLWNLFLPHSPVKYLFVPLPATISYLCTLLAVRDWFTALVNIELGTKGKVGAMLKPFRIVIYALFALFVVVIFTLASVMTWVYFDNLYMFNWFLVVGFFSAGMLSSVFGAYSAYHSTKLIKHIDIDVVTTNELTITIREKLLVFRRNQILASVFTCLLIPLLLVWMGVSSRNGEPGMNYSFYVLYFAVSFLEWLGPIWVPALFYSPAKVTGSSHGSSEGGRRKSYTLSENRTNEVIKELTVPS